MSRPRRGFTLLEVMASVLVLTIALTAACGLILYGLHLVRSAHGRSVGMATAMSVLEDPSPLRTDPTLSPAGPASSGYLNGLWVVRSESDEVPLDGTGRLVAVSVQVDVYGTAYGEVFASLSARVVRRK